MLHEQPHPDFVHNSRVPLCHLQNSSSAEKGFVKQLGGIGSEREHHDRKRQSEWPLASREPQVVSNPIQSAKNLLQSAVK